MWYRNCEKIKYILQGYVHGKLEPVKNDVDSYKWYQPVKKTYEETMNEIN